MVHSAQQISTRSSHSTGDSVSEIASAPPIPLHPSASAPAGAEDLTLQGLDRFRLEWLVSFVAVAHLGGVLAAARHLYRSQPRVSCHISELESALGTVLFDRSIRPVALTPAGARLLGYAELVLGGVRTLASAASALPTPHAEAPARAS